MPARSKESGVCLCGAENQAYACPERRIRRMPGKDGTLMQKNRKAAKWSRLDNAAKIFPSSSRKTDTSVFRFYCELREDVERGFLQEAVLSAIRQFPHFQSVMRKGAFWYYLEQSDLVPTVVEEQGPVCSRIYEGDNSTLLFEVSYRENRINLEIYHALSDGTGALQFLKTIVYYYLKAVHGDRLSKDLVFLESDASHTEKESDSFSKYYQKEKGKKERHVTGVYRLQYPKNGTDTLQVIEAVMSVKEVLKSAHQYHATLTTFLTAVFIQAIHKEMSVGSLKKPVVIMVPVNLRQFFPSETTKNFFGLIDISYDFSKSSGELPDILEEISRNLKEKLTKEYLSAKMNRLAAIERNPFAKIAPLPLKNISLKIARAVEERNQTAVISNVGKVTMPQELAEYISLFGVLASTLKLQVCMCSFGDNLNVSFTSAFVSTDIQKNFVRFLSKQGVDVTIRSNEFYKG